VVKTAISDSLPIGQEPTNFLHVTGFNELGLSQASFTFGALFRQNMTVVRFAKLIFSAAGFIKPFCSSAIGFDFRHYPLSFYVANRIGLLSSNAIRCNPSNHHINNRWRERK
jgi:hypothetical protein